MEKKEFLMLSQSERDWLIFNALPKSTAPGESPIAPIFNKTHVATPVQNVPGLPAGFTSVFGEDQDFPYGSPERAVLENRLKRWGGLYNLSQLPDYDSKVNKSIADRLGYPIGYIFDGDVFVTFDVFGKNGVVWYRDLSQYMNNFEDLANTANLVARNKGLI